MDYLSYGKRLDYILELIRKNRFRTVDDAATRFNCSTRTVKRMLNHLRDRGYDIQYDRLQKKYFIKEKQ
jgi:DeoR/GlpR family transcriptional regulator of sugar metabolism